MDQGDHSWNRIASGKDAEKTVEVLGLQEFGCAQGCMYYIDTAVEEEEAQDEAV